MRTSRVLTSGVVVAVFAGAAAIGLGRLIYSVAPESATQVSFIGAAASLGVSLYLVVALVRGVGAHTLAVTYGLVAVGGLVNALRMAMWFSDTVELGLTVVSLVCTVGGGLYYLLKARAGVGSPVK